MSFKQIMIYFSIITTIFSIVKLVFWEPEPIMHQPKGGDAAVIQEFERDTGLIPDPENDTLRGRESPEPVPNSLS